MFKKKCKKVRAKTKFYLSLFAFFLMIVLFFCYAEIVVNPMILRVAQAEVDSVATTSISDAIFDVINDQNADYSSVINVAYNNEGNITSITSNMEKMNFIAREISTKSQIYLDNLGQIGVKVSLGAFTGFEVFANLGPKISLKMTPIGSVITSFRSSFDEAGINQTRHSIYVDVNTVIGVILPTSSQKMNFVTSALLCESVIVGKVPSVYLNVWFLLK